MAGRTPLNTWYKICKQGNISQQIHVSQWLYCLYQPPLSSQYILRSRIVPCIFQASILPTKSASASELYGAFSATVPSSCSHRDLICIRMISSLGFILIGTTTMACIIGRVQDMDVLHCWIPTQDGRLTPPTAQPAHTLKTLGASPAESVVAAHLRGGVAVKDRDPCEHLQHDHSKAVHVARAGHPPVMQHLHWLVRHRACTINHQFTQSSVEAS